MVQPKTEELLYLLLWTLNQAMRPTFRNLDESFEGWAYRHGLLRQLRALEERSLIESQPAESGTRDRVWRLTGNGVVHALGGRNPQEHWDRPWDGRWRLVLFDIAEERRAERRKLRAYLRSRGFGYLQNSVWLSPHPVEPERLVLRDGAVDVESLLLLEARPAARESDEDLVRGAWNFTAINRGYERAIAVLAARPRRPIGTPDAAEALRRWGRDERFAWNKAVAEDPLLPRALWPRGYLGEKAWNRRRKELTAAARLVRHFRPPAA